MHDLLYENIETWNGPSSVDPNGATIDQAAAIFEQFAAQLSLDVEQFKADYASEDVARFINTQAGSGRQLNLSSTPSLLLNGEQIATPGSLEELRATLQAAVDQAANSEATNQ
jgi:predicted DsbA family dithiol-disulfide isomerase